jgi:4-hydroxybenzoate polyprenyltransferase
LPIIAGLEGMAIYTIAIIAMHLVLWFYSSTGQRLLIFGNLIVSLLCGGVVWIYILIDLGYLSSQNISGIPSTTTLIVFGSFAFFSNFIREIVKDAEDAPGDSTQRYNSLILVYGPDRTILIIRILLVSLVCFISYIGILAYNHVNLYVLFFIFSALLLLIFVIRRVNQLAWASASTHLKFVMLLGLMSLIVL